MSDYGKQLSLNTPELLDSKLHMVDKSDSSFMAGWCDLQLTVIYSLDKGVGCTHAGNPVLVIKWSEDNLSSSMGIPTKLGCQNGFGSKVIQNIIMSSLLFFLDTDMF